MKGWKPLGSVDAQHLVNARLQLHWGAQVAAAVGKQLLPAQPDFGQQSFEWVERPGVLAQGILAAGKPPFRSALRPADLALVLLDAEEGPLAELPLSGHTLDEAYAWLTAEVEARLGHPLEQPLDRPGSPPAMPAHPVGTGRRFTLADPAPFVEVARWFANGDLLLREIAEREPGASPVRCWPHHFDLATLITVDASASAETARTIGVGLSPGDADRGAPYFYVAPWPSPTSPALPDLAGGGTWNTTGWWGAVLEAGALFGGVSGSDPEGQARRFLESAIDACRELVA